jgi:hypothetical protein
MKYIQWVMLLAFLSLIGFTACQKGDDHKDKLVGIWLAEKFTVSDDGEVENFVAEDNEVSSNVQIEFTENGTLKMVLSGKNKKTGETDLERINGTYTWQDDDTIQVLFSAEGENQVYSLSGDPKFTDADKHLSLIFTNNGTPALSLQIEAKRQ